MSGYRIKAPLLFVKDQNGRLHQIYHNGWVPWLNEEQRKHFLRHGLVEEVDAPPADIPAASTPEQTPVERPLKTAPKEAWVDYGVSAGTARAELEALSKQELLELLS